jgi:hypothetical protein
MLLVASLLAGVALGACGGDDKKASNDCKPGSDPALEAAARAHVDTIIIGVKTVDKADNVTVDSCKTGDEDATATVTVEGLHDRVVRDQRHQMTLKKRNGKWAIVQDSDTLRCREGHGHQDFSTLQCR